MRVQRSRIVFLAAPYHGQATDGIVWMLVSSNNRPLGRGATYHEVYARCRDSVLDLQANVDRVVPLEGTVPANGQWNWRIELDGVPVALSSRSYLRARECTYNLERFLEALPHADVVPGTRGVRRRRSPEPLPPVRSVNGPSHPSGWTHPDREALL
ncbi:hypothetical protein [Micromonospora sp. WMMD1082]|uniref:hypothetical protein n=1 Tax=Micromonospora sp. WMMD1082 TaxID=3016104 RepID=UPI002416FB22|nr:hypothetical protein [Micromonospora sp. WMMD1082]MDG4795277.1 hypothetical protein [Micromonospora sp. WMMD1082]